MHDIETLEQMHTDLLKEELEKRITKLQVMKEKLLKLKEKAIKLIVNLYNNQLFNVLAVLCGTILGLARTGFLMLFLLLYIVGAIINKNNRILFLGVKQ